MAVPPSGRGRVPTLYCRGGWGALSRWWPPQETQVGEPSTSRTRPTTTARRSSGRCRRGGTFNSAAVLVLSTASLRTAAQLHPDGVWDPRRFRPNVLIDVAGKGWLEDEWVGGTLSIGAVVLVPLQPCIRCTMVTRAQPGLEADVERLPHPGPSPSWSLRRLVRRAHRRHPVSRGRSDRRSPPPRRGWRTPLATVLPEVPICPWPGCHAITPR